MTFAKPVAAMLVTASPLMLAASPARAQPVVAQSSGGGFTAAADAILQAAYPADGHGAVLIVTRGGRVIHAAARGFADVEARQPVTPDHVFKLGSITKQFTAAAVLKLVEEGKVRLDDPVSRFFPDFPQPAARATVRQLLNHSSGLQDLTKVPGWIVANRQRPHTTAELLAVFRDLPAKSEPGHRWEYNNGGYVMLGAMIEKVTGKPWHEVVAEKVTRPLGLRSIVYGQSQVMLLAAGHTEAEGKQRKAPATHMSVPHAAGGLVGSVGDLAKWAHALHGRKVVSPALYTEMITPAKLADGSTEPYGFGLRLRELRGRPARIHGGAISGFSTDSAYIPSEDVFVAVFANSDDPKTDPTEVMIRAAALAIGEPIPTFSRAQVDPKQVQALFGTYGSAGDDQPPRRFFHRDNAFYIARGDDQIQLLPAGGDRFYTASDGLTWLQFTRQADGKHVMEVHAPSDRLPKRAVRTGDVPAPLAIAPEVLRSYAGKFQTGGPLVTIALGKDGRLTASVGSNPPLPMRPVSQTDFMVDEASASIHVHAENGAPDRITIRRGARELQGRRLKD